MAVLLQAYLLPTSTARDFWFNSYCFNSSFTVSVNSSGIRVTI